MIWNKKPHKKAAIKNVVEFPPDFLELLAARLEDRNWNQTLACCQDPHGTFVNYGFSPPIYIYNPETGEGGRTLGGTDYPQAMYVCLNCGHTRYYSLEALDLLDELGRYVQR